jgi:hypothetical protein
VTTSKITKLALIAAATSAAAIALPATAHADPPYYKFQSPSGNIHCGVAVDGKNTPNAVCTIRQASYAGQLCQEPGLTIPQFELAQDGHAADMEWCTEISGGWPTLPTLDYGQTRSVGAITCDSEPAGVTCTDGSTGHFFRVSRESYQLG